MTGAAMPAPTSEWTNVLLDCMVGGVGGDESSVLKGAVSTPSSKSWTVGQVPRSGFSDIPVSKCLGPAPQTLFYADDADLPDFRGFVLRWSNPECLAPAQASLAFRQASNTAKREVLDPNCWLCVAT
jgi:hypothetical protein